MFCYFDDGDYRWGQYFIRATAAGFTVNSVSVPSLLGAAEQAGTTESVLRSWIGRAKPLKVYSIERDGKSGVIEVMLEGSDWMPYGLQYAPPQKPIAYEELMFQSHSRSAGFDHNLRHLHGPWFYFEGKRGL